MGNGQVGRRSSWYAPTHAVMEPARLGASFRDPSGFVFNRDGVLLRQVNRTYEADFLQLFQGGLHEELVEAGLLVPSHSVDLGLALEADAVAVLRPERLPIVSYPYEWAFGALKDAALATLEIARRALERGMVLKDASAYNIQFLQGKPLLIDTLSFETYREGEAWIAYRQFCGHFLAPLALMAHVDIRLGGLLRTHLDGVPLDLASRLLPAKTWLKPGLLLHLHRHAKATNRPATEEVRKATFPRIGFLALLDSLRGTIEGLKWEPSDTQWAGYYEDTNYSEAAMADKRRLVADLLQGIDGSCWDLGANTGDFSRIAAGLGLQTVAWDFDPGAVQLAYARRDAGVLPLLQDLTNPSPNLGWAGRERDSLAARGPADVVMALALVHHLAIGNNVPLDSVAAYLARLGKRAIVEFVRKDDSQVRRLLASRRDVFPDYTEAGFEAAFSRVFSLEAKEPIAGTQRTLYRFLRREA